jgi:hypothetical protein
LASWADAPPEKKGEATTVASSSHGKPVDRSQAGLAAFFFTGLGAKTPRQSLVAGRRWGIKKALSMRESRRIAAGPTSREEATEPPIVSILSYQLLESYHLGYTTFRALTMIVGVESRPSGKAARTAGRSPIHP